MSKNKSKVILNTFNYNPNQTTTNTQQLPEIPVNTSAGGQVVAPNSKESVTVDSAMDNKEIQHQNTHSRWLCDVVVDALPSSAVVDAYCYCDEEDAEN